MPEPAIEPPLNSHRFATLRDALYAASPESRERVGAILSDLRADQGITQVALADALDTTQSAVSRIERQDDWRLSTLREYVAATGGRLRLIADYGDHVIEFGSDDAE